MRVENERWGLDNERWGVDNERRGWRMRDWGKITRNGGG